MAWPPRTLAANTGAGGAGYEPTSICNLKMCPPTISGCQPPQRRPRYVAVFWAALSQGNLLDRVATYHSRDVTPSEFAQGALDLRAVGLCAMCPCVGRRPQQNCSGRSRTGHGAGTVHPPQLKRHEGASPIICRLALPGSRALRLLVEIAVQMYSVARNACRPGNAEPCD
jgi:hypothetical protein